MGAVLLFLDKYKAQIIELIIVIAVVVGVKLYIESVYKDGYNAGAVATEKTWKIKYDTDIAALNKKVTDTESDSRKKADEITQQLGVANKKIEELQAQIESDKAKYNRQIYNKQGAVVCTTQQDIYLGPTFSAEWNKLNSILIQNNSQGETK